MTHEDRSLDRDPLEASLEAAAPESIARPHPSIALPLTAPSSSRNASRALQYPNFRLLLVGIFLTGFAQQMLTIAIGWELYSRTSSALALGGIGLAQVIPLILLFLPAGYAADRVNRKYLLAVTELVAMLATLGLAILFISARLAAVDLRLSGRAGCSGIVQLSHRVGACLAGAAGGGL